MPVTMFELITFCVEATAIFACENGILMPDEDEMFSQITEGLFEKEIIISAGVRDTGELEYNVNHAFTEEEIFYSADKMMHEILQKYKQ